MKCWIIVISFLAIGLSGCTTMNSSFDCPNKAGVRCKSLDQINAMVDSGQIREHETMSEVDVMSVTNESEFQVFSFKASLISSPTRYPETVQRIWIAPYEDTEGNYHQDSFMYSVMKGGHWKGNPVKTIHSS